MAYEPSKSEQFALLGGINVKASPYINGPTEFRDLSNLNFFIPGSLTKRPGSDYYLGATVQGRITGLTEFEKLSGASYLIASANTNVYSVTGSYTSIRAGVANDALFDFVTFVDRLFLGNGVDFFKFDGTNTSSFSLPPPPNTFGITGVVGGSLTSGFTGTFVGTYGYVNDRGYFGPAADGVTVTINGITFNSIAYYGLTGIAVNFGASGIALYRSTVGGIDPAGTTTIALSSLSPGATFVDPGLQAGTRVTSDAVFFTLAPKYFEIYNNQLFMAGFTQIPSTAIWSDIGEPESIQPEYSAEFRTNDGDVIKGLKAYSGSLIVTKKRSTHRVTGDNPDNFQLQEISDQYGCISNRAMVTWEDKLWFLDSKGIVQYDGSNIKIVSNKVEPFFIAMNTLAAEDNAIAIHYRQYNEVWFSIPVNGSSINNRIVVYDYLADAWTKYDGIQAASLIMAKGSRPAMVPIFGGYTGTVSYFSPSLMADAGRAMTCIMDTYYVKPRGETVESQFRMFWLNTVPILDPIAAVTNNITINFKPDYGQTIAVTRTMSQNPFQNRVQFGIPARSLAAQMFHVSATLPLTINGYAFASRYQRNV